MRGLTHSCVALRCLEHGGQLVREVLARPLGGTRKTSVLRNRVDDSANGRPDHRNAQTQAFQRGDTESFSVREETAEVEGADELDESVEGRVTCR